MEGLTVEIEAKQPPVEQWRRFVYCSTLSGPVFGTVDHLRAEGNALSLLSLACCCFFYEHGLISSGGTACLFEMH